MNTLEPTSSRIGAIWVHMARVLRGSRAHRTASRDYNARPPRRASALKKSDFHFDLPAELIAQKPLA
jgi:hypothetical protein